MLAGLFTYLIFRRRFTETLDDRSVLIAARCYAMPLYGGWMAWCLSVTFMYCVETADDTAIVAMQCDLE